MKEDQTQIFQERRRYIRHKVDIPISLCYLGNFSLHRCTDISEGGMLISLKELEIPKDAPIEICIIVPKLGAIILYGQIVYQLNIEENKRYAGVAFTKVSTEEKKYLNQLISSLS